MSPGEDRTVRADELLGRLRHATLGDFEILSEAGRGGMAVVYLAHDLSLDRKVAIKVISPNILWMGEGIAERFKREARVSASLSHPHIIPIYAVKESEDLLFFVMKYVPGRTLEDVMAEVGPLPPGMVHTILTQIGGALGYAHRHGVVHRDIKPANIMLDEEGWAVITDFGIAKVATGEGLTQTGSAVGTPAYMSPEQCSGLPVSGASDQYALSVVAYEMLAGRKPFEASTAMALMYKHVHARPEPLERWVPDCPPSLVEAVMRGLEKAPDDRWPKMEDMISALGSVPQADPHEVRTQMLELARSSSARAIVEKFQTPQSPVPSSRRARSAEESRPGTGAPEAGAAEETAATPIPPQGPVPPTTLSIPLPSARRLAWAGVPLAAVAIAVLWAPWRGAEPDPGDGEPPAPAPPVLPTTAAMLELVPADRTIEVGESVELRLGAWDDDGEEMELDEEVVWTSSDPAVARISGMGVVTALAPGPVEITAQAAGRTVRAQIIVLERAPADDPPPPATRGAVARIEVAPPSATLRAGETLRLQATPRDEQGRPLAGRAVAWSTSDDRIARVSADGTVSAVAPGSVRITASTEGRSQAATLTIAPPPTPAPGTPSSVEVTPRSGTLRSGESVRLQAAVFDAGGRTITDPEVRWTSSDERVAVVTAGGEVRGVGPGSARITAASGNVSASAEVVVEAEVEPQPAPPGPGNPALEVAAVVDAYARALQARDLAEARRIYPGMTPAQEEGWRTFLDNVRELSVTMALADLALEGDRATAEVRMTLAYRAQRREEDTSTIRMTLGREAGAWRILEIR